MLWSMPVCLLAVARLKCTVQGTDTLSRICVLHKACESMHMAAHMLCAKPDGVAWQGQNLSFERRGELQAGCGRAAGQRLPIPSEAARSIKDCLSRSTDLPCMA